MQSDRLGNVVRRQIADDVQRVGIGLGDFEALEADVRKLIDVEEIGTLQVSTQFRAQQLPALTWLVAELRTDSSGWKGYLLLWQACDSLVKTRVGQCLGEIIVHDS